MNVKTLKKYEIINGEKELKLEEDHDINGNIVCSREYCDDIIIIREHDYDDHNNMIYTRDLRGDEYQVTYHYDDHGSIIYMEDRYYNRHYWKHEYDKKGNKTYTKDDDGNEYYYEYRTKSCNEKEIHIVKKYEMVNGDKRFIRESHYDKNNNLIYDRSCLGDESFYTYDDHNNVVYMKNSNGNEYYWIYEYNDHDDVIYMRDNYGYESWFEYTYRESSVPSELLNV